MNIGSFDLPDIISAIVIGIVIVALIIRLVFWTLKNRKVT